MAMKAKKMPPREGEKSPKSSKIASMNNLTLNIEPKWPGKEPSAGHPLQ
jgi:hypothetical protein